MRLDLPTGTVTFLFTDVEGSTRLLHELGAEGYAEVLAEHRRVIRAACAAEGGVEVDTQGDAFFFAFPSALGAVAAASVFTEALSSGPISVRVGLHSGSPLVTDEGYIGDDVHVAARVAASSHGGQVVLSAATAALLSPGDTVSQGVSLTDLGEHRLKDIPVPLAIFQLGDGSFPSLKTIANTNLPTPVSSFLGREEELYEADVLLQGTRLLTVTGPGGAGKTRFALELARRAREERFSDYPAGVFACFLSPLRDPSLVLPTIAQTLGVPDQPATSALDALASHLEGKRMLVLLDNLEHLLDAAVELVQLLERCAGLTLLVTSREVLRAGGETTYQLPPLPDDESVALVCARAQVEPSEPIQVLARRLEGLPLAIELAAARLSILTPKQLLKRLSQRLDVLKGGRDADPRQQTLRATIEWSYDLLTPQEQQLFARLSVFAGGCTLEAAEDVADAELDTLQSLVEKSLLRFTDGRYWMLETIREFAMEELQAHGDELLQGRFVEWTAQLLEQRFGEMGEVDPEGDLADIAVERDNVRSALAWAWAHERVDVGIRIGSSALRYWGRASPGDASAWLDQIDARVLPVEPSLQLRALRGAGAVAYHFQGDGDRALRLWNRAIDIAADGRAPRDFLWLRGHMATLSRERGELPAALAAFRSNLDAYERLDDRYEQARTLHELGDTYFDLGEVAAAEAMFSRAVTLNRADGRTSPLLHNLHSWGDLAQSQGQLSCAASRYREALELSVTSGDDISVVYCIAGLASVLVRMGRIEAGASLWGSVMVLEDALGFRLVPGTRRRYEPQLVPLEASDAWERGRSLTLDEAVEYALSSLD
jgi:predicted ATPase/class 3 adenylate cyclase